MRLTFEQLKAKMPEITALLITHPLSQDDRATEIWIKFKKDGKYAYINFEQPLPAKINLEKLVGSGDALNCSDTKKNDLTQYAETKEVTDILKNSYYFKGNLKETVLKVEELFENFTGTYLAY